MCINTDSEFMTKGFLLFLFFNLATIALFAQEYQTDANTVLLLHMNETSGSAVSDASGNSNNGTASGTTIVDGWFGKARSFNGTSDVVVTTYNGNFGTDPFTVEFWVYLNSLAASHQNIIGNRMPGLNTWWVGVIDDGRINVDGGIGQNASNIGDIVAGQWYHIAVTRNASNVLTIYKNGVVVKTGTQTGNFTLGTNVSIGAIYGGGEFVNGVIDEVRISNIARSPGEFNLPDANTVLLFHMDEPTGSTVTDASTLVNHGTATGTTIVEGRLGKARSFNGTSDVVTTNYNGNFGTGPFTVEFWVYLNSLAAPHQNIIGNRMPAGSNTWWVGVFDDGRINVDGGSARNTSNAGDIVAGQWYHIAVTRNASNVLTIYKNGIVVKTGTQTGNFTAGTNVSVGAIYGGGEFVNGMVDEVRISNIARLPSEFNLTFSPTITALTPAFGPVGSSVNVTGTNFSTTLSNNIVWFGATKATVTNATSTQLTVTVPAGATYSPITVTVNGLTAYSPKPFIVSSTSNWYVSFSSGLEFSTGSFSPLRLQVSDVDGDSKPDAITTNTGPSVSILRNISTPGNLASGAFASRVEFTTGISPAGFALGDLDGDGKPDLVVANSSDGTISVLKNTSTPGTISFNTRVDFTSGSNPQRVAIFDVDGDGKPEILAVNSTSYTVRVFINSGPSGVINSSTFSTSIVLPTGENPNGIAVADLDGDGKIDVAVSNYNNATVYVYRNTSNPGVPSFSSSVGFITGSNPKDVVLGDMDGDGKQEINTGDVTSDIISILRNISSPGSINTSSFDLKVNYASPTISLDGLTMDDISGDGKPDFGIIDSDWDIYVVRNTNVPGTISASQFQSIANIDIFASGYNANNNLIFCDIDGDNKKELLAPRYSGAKLIVFENTSVAEPVNQPTNLSFTNVTSSSLVISYTADADNPTGYLVLRREGAAPSTDPSDGTSYTVGSSLGFATVVQVGSATSFSETGLGRFQNFLL